MYYKNKDRVKITTIVITSTTKIESFVFIFYVFALVLFCNFGHTRILKIFK